MILIGLKYLKVPDLIFLNAGESGDHDFIVRFFTSKHKILAPLVK